LGLESQIVLLANFILFSVLAIMCLYVVRHYPQYLLAGWLNAWLCYFRSGSNYPHLYGNLSKIVAMNVLYEYLCYGKVPRYRVHLGAIPIYYAGPNREPRLYVFLLIGLPLLVVYGMRLALRGRAGELRLETSQQALLLYLCANIIYVVALIQAPIYVRLARGEILSAKERAYADAARCLGNSGPRIIFGHLLPNCIPPILVQVAVNLSWAILNAAGLSFIGLGVRPPTPEWGVMINEGMSFMLSGQLWLVFFPGMAIFITILGFNLLADGLRDVFDPRLRW